MEAGSEEQLIDVDIAQAREDGLVEKRGFDRARGFGEASMEEARAYQEGIGSEVGPVGGVEGIE